MRIFEEVAGNIAFLLHQKHGYLLIMLIDIELPNIQIDYGKHKYLISKEMLHMTEIASFIFVKSYKPSDLSDFVKGAVYLAKLGKFTK